MIAFDLQALQSSAHGERGIARYVADLARTLSAQHAGVVDAFLWNDQLPFVERLDQLGLGHRLRSFSDVRGGEFDVLHVNSPFEALPLADCAVPIRARRTVTTCYDLIPYRFPSVYLSDAATSARYRTRLGALVASDFVITDSKSAADDIVKLLGVSPHRVAVIGAGVSEQFVPPTGDLGSRLAQLRLAVPGIEARYIFVPTGMDWRKNIKGALRAFSELEPSVRDRHQLVLSCRVTESERRWLSDESTRHGIADRVLVTGYVTDEVLVLLYQTAELVVFPSYYEGFGLPVLEARRCGARVICSGVSSLPEVHPDPRATFNPFDHEHFAAVLSRSLTDASFGAVLDGVPDPGFDWTDSSNRLVGVYRRLLADLVGGTRTVRRPRRLGVATILPPTPSGIADHSVRLLEAFGQLDGVEPVAFVAGTASGIAGSVAYEVHELATLPAHWAAGDLDAVLYCFGNNQFHRDLLESLRHVPGHVLLHDVRLRGMFREQERIHVQARYYGLPPNRDDGDHDDDVGSDEDRGELGHVCEEPLFALPVTRYAMSVMVQSQHAAELVRGDTGVDALNVGPHPCAPHEPASPPSGKPWVVSAGIASSSKQTGKFVGAMRLLTAEGRCMAAIVGKDGGEFVDPQDDITVTGTIPDPEFESWLRRATLLVQLRAITNGESSGVVAHAMALGVPLIVSDIGAMAELPDDAVVKVPVDISSEALGAVISDLLDDERRRTRMRVAGLAFAGQETALAQARRIVDAVFVAAGSG